MNDTYIQNQNISNNIIFKNPNNNSKVKITIKKKENIDIYTSSDEDKNETIDNKVNDSSTSLDIEEVPKLEEEIDHLDKFNKAQKYFQKANNQNAANISRNKSKATIISNDLKCLTNQHHLSRAISGNILPLHRNTNITLGNDKNNFGFGKMTFKKSTSGDRNTSKEIKSRFSSASENKYQFLPRKTVSNEVSHLNNNIFYKNNNSPISTAKVTKLNQKIEDDRHNYNKKNNLIENQNEIYQDSKNINNYYVNSNISGNLNPSINNHMTNVKKIVNYNLERPKSISINNLNNENNNNLNGEQFQDKILIHNNIKIINNFGSNSPKNHLNISNLNLNNSPTTNFVLLDRNNNIDYLQNNEKFPIDRINFQKLKIIDNDNKQRLTNISINNGNLYSINKDKNSIQRLTVPYKLSPAKANNNNQYFMKKELIQNQIQISPQIHLDRSIKQVPKSKSPSIAKVKKLPPLINNNRTNLYFNEINSQLISKINRHSISPSNNIKRQSIENSINNNLNYPKNKIKNIKIINKSETNNIQNKGNQIQKIDYNMNEINNMKINYKNKNEKNNIIKNSKSMKNLNIIKNNINIMNNMNNINKINSRNNNMNTLINDIDNINILNDMNIMKTMNGINNTFKLNKNMNISNNIGIPNKNSVSRNPNIKKNIENINSINKTSSKIQNKILQNSLLNNQDKNIISRIKQNTNTLSFKFLPQFTQSNTPKNSEIDNPNKFIPLLLQNINAESQRLTQIPNNFYEIKNKKYIQNEIPNHSTVPYSSNQNNIFISNDNQFFNNLENEKINLINVDYRVKKGNKSNELINQKNIEYNFNKFDSNGWVKNYGILTLPGKDISGEQKINQDSFVFKTKINNVKDFNIFGVLDGHGPEGHFVSKFTSEFIPSLLSNHPEIKPLTDPEKIYKKLKDNNCRIIIKTFIEADNQLKKVSFDATESGCTCVLIIHIGSHIICANTGDSRAIVVFGESNDNNINYYQHEPLSIDCKPEIPQEAKRIIMNGGEVRQMKNELGEGVGPYRVWAKDGNYPGLAMSRSIGDLKGKNIGVIPDPSILEYDLCTKTKYIVACSDGVWEFLNNENVRDIGKKYYINNNPSGFCHELVSQSLNLWEKNDIVVDDITAVVAFF